MGVLTYYNGPRKLDRKNKKNKLIKKVILNHYKNMSNTRQRYSSEYKVKIVLEILSNTGTLTEIAWKYGLHPTMISGWKTEFLERSKEIFADPRIKKIDTELKEKEEALDEAHRQIGQLTIERDWLKKKYKQLWLLWP